jgi:hypothetical protein
MFATSQWICPWQGSAHERLFVARVCNAETGERMAEPRQGTGVRNAEDGTEKRLNLNKK